MSGGFVPRDKTSNFGNDCAGSFHQTRTVHIDQRAAVNTRLTGEGILAETGVASEQGCLFRVEWCFLSLYPMPITFFVRSKGLVVFCLLISGYPIHWNVRDAVGGSP